MASSYSTDLKLQLMVTGEDPGTWGDNTNNNLNLLQQAIGGYELVTITANTTLVMVDASITSNARNAVIELTGTISANATVNIPNSPFEKTYIVENSTTGAYTVTFRGALQTTNFVTWSTTDKGIKTLFVDGTNVVDVGNALSTIRLPNQNEVRFGDADNSNYVSLRAGATIASNVSFTLPTADGTSGQAIVTNGSGALSFATAGISTGKAIAMAIVFG
jgi:hypothetical protein